MDELVQQKLRELESWLLKEITHYDEGFIDRGELASGMFTALTQVAVMNLTLDGKWDKEWPACR